MKSNRISQKIRSIIATILRRLGVLPGPWDRTHQGSFAKFKTDIFNGNVPERYTEIASNVPGGIVLDVGSADGTLALQLATLKKEVHGAEISKVRFKTALQLKKAWIGQGLISDNCTFHNRSITELEDLLSRVDCVVLIRVLYHLKEDASSLFRMIKEKDNIQFVVVCGNATKEAKVANGEQLPGLEGYESLATEKGISAFIEEYGFVIKDKIRLQSAGDCLVVGARSL